MALVLLLMSGCAVTMENVTYEARRGGYPGYRIEYLGASPEPGTVLTAGVPVRFDVTVRYTLQSAETGNLLLTFRDERDVELVPSHQVSQTIERGRTEKTTLSQELVIPRRVQVLFVRIPVWPEGVRDPVGALRLRYPVSPGK